jgi:hypothetical protein
MHFVRLARLPMWIAGSSVCILATLGIVAISRTIPASYANIRDDGAPSKHAAAPARPANARAADTQAHRALEAVTVDRRNRPSCPECGVVESMRQIERSSESGRQEAVAHKATKGVAGDSPGSAIAANAATRKGYEFTVRFRDGSTAVFSEASPRTWRLGSRVMVIGLENTANH